MECRVKVVVALAIALSGFTAQADPIDLDLKASEETVLPWTKSKERKLEFATKDLQATHVAIYPGGTNADDILRPGKTEQHVRIEACMLALGRGTSPAKALLDWPAAEAADKESISNNCRSILEAKAASSHRIRLWPTNMITNLKVKFPPDSGQVVRVESEKVDGTEKFLPPPLLGQGVVAGSYHVPNPDGTWTIGTLEGDPSQGEPLTIPENDWDKVAAALHKSENGLKIYVLMASGCREYVTLIDAPGKALTRLRLRQACEESVKALADPDSSDDDKWFYLVCVDYTDPRSPNFITLTSKPGEDPDANGHLFAGHRVKVRVWFGDEVKQASATLDGVPAPKNTTYGVGELDQKFTYNGHTEILEEMGKYPSTDWDFSSSNATSRRLKVGVDTKDVKYEHEAVYMVEQVYSGAISMGLSVSWAPWNRRYKLESSATPGNKGQVIGVSEGNKTGTFSTELTLSYVFFIGGVREHRRDVRFGVLLGLGLVKADNDGLDMITSLHIGPALVVGRQFSAVLDLSLQRTRWLEGDLRPGSAVATSSTLEDVTTFGVTPAFGIVLNFSPAFWKKVGQVGL